MTGPHTALPWAKRWARWAAHDGEGEEGRMRGPYIALPWARWAAHDGEGVGGTHCTTMLHMTVWGWGGSQRSHPALPALSVSKS